MSLLARTKEAIVGLIGPWIFLYVSASVLPKTIRKLLRDRKYGVLFSPAKLRAAWFSDFWGSIAGPNVRLNAGERVKPLLEGRVTNGAVVDEPVGPGIAGTVVELGAGSGLWVDVFKEVADTRQEPTGGAVKRRAAAKRAVTRVYGVEPNHDQHPDLRRAIAKAGLEDVYQIVPVGIEDLEDASKWDGRVEKGSVDCIVSVLCLCSIPDPEENIREMYSYLKKGGRWYVYEHVRCEYSWYMRAYQRFVNIFWPHFLGGCQLCRPTEKTLREAGPWEKIDVGQPPIEPWYQSVPHILGVFVK
ncbi:S-adenosyl-L-methionine-dependent methyltransferase [Jackrogersella minutella]|nr:S-adenosyl-L-methionine-dependent methyltransferase [Jackrogersella minutella]